MSTKTISIYGLSFEVGTPYAEGHAMTPAEAKALNQVRAENISNNVRKTIGALRDDGAFSEANAALAQTTFAEADASYIFTLANAGSGRKVMDPVDREATVIARTGLSAKLKERKMSIKEYDAANGEGAFAAKVAIVALREDVRKLAAKRVKERAAEDFDI